MPTADQILRLRFCNDTFFPSAEKLFCRGLILTNLAVLGPPVVVALTLTMMIKTDSTYSVFSLLSSTGMSPRENSPDDRGRSPGPLHQIQGDLPQPANPPGARGPPEDLWSVLYIPAFACSSCFQSLLTFVLYNVLYCDISLFISFVNNRGATMHLVHYLNWHTALPMSN